MQFFPSRAIFLQIGNITIRWYAICIVIGALIAYYLSNREAVKDGYDKDFFDDIFIGCMLCGVVGARIWYCLFFDFKGYFSNPISIIQIWDGGLAIQGGLIAGALFVYFYSKKHHYSFWHIADLTMPNVLIAQACGRWGNYFNQEAYGNIVDEEYFNGILSFIKKGMYINRAYRQPMFLYESLLCLLGFVLIKLYRKYSKTYRGDGVFCYIAWYGAIRFWIESQRTDSLMIGNFRTAQIISIIFLAIGIPGLLGAFRKLINKEKPVIVFDLDGTLVDTYPIISKTFEQVFSEVDPELELTEEDKAGFMGPTLKETFNRYTPDLDADELIARYREINDKLHEGLQTFPNVKETLDYLKENGYKVAIASSKLRATVEKGLTVTGLRDYFDIIVGLEDAEKTKPDKESIWKAINQAGGKFVNAVYVGDAEGDILAAQNAGVYSVAYCSMPLKKQELLDAKPNVLIEDMAQLIDVLKEDHQWTYNMK